MVIMSSLATFLLQYLTSPLSLRRSSRYHRLFFLSHPQQSPLVRHWYTCYARPDTVHTYCDSARTSSSDGEAGKDPLQSREFN